MLDWEYNILVRLNRFNNIRMQEIRRNLLYEVKKEANKRADLFYNPNSEDDDIRAENQRLRTKIRSQDT